MTMSQLEGKKLIDEIKKTGGESTEVAKSAGAVDLNQLMESNELSGEAFNEVDYACMLVNTHIRMALRDLPKALIFTNPVVGKLRDIILVDDSGSPQKIASTLYTKFPKSSFDRVIEKLSFYSNLTTREDINHYLEILNKRVKKNVFDGSLAEYFDKKDLDKLISKIDDLTENIHSAVIPFTSLHKLKVSDIQDSYADKNKLLSSCDRLNKSSYYHSLLKGQLVVVAAPPNCGKTQFMVNEAYFHAKNGYKVAYLAMGDSMESDFTIKLGCLHFNVVVDDFINSIEKYINDPGFKRVLANIDLSVVASGELLSSDVRRYYKSDPILSKADVYFFDYDSNFKEMSTTDMYSAHDIIYNNVYALARLKEPKLVYIASQVKTGYYNKEIIPQNALAESNRKQSIADYVVTISGFTDGTKNCGVINIAKARRGKKGFSHYTMTKTGKFMAIDKSLYNTMRSSIKAAGELSNE